MGPRFLIDTNVIIDFLMGTLPEEGEKWFIEKVNNQECCISPINQIEVLGYNGGPKEMSRAEAFVRDSKSLPIDKEVVAQTILLKRKKRMKLPDAVIAATAIVHGLTLRDGNQTNLRSWPSYFAPIPSKKYFRS